MYIWINKEVLLHISTNKGRKWEGVPNGGCSKVVAYLVPKQEIINGATMIVPTTPQQS